MATQAVTQPAPVQGQLKVRQSVSQLSADQLAAYRNAVATIMNRPDNRGYQYFANWHGVAFGLCQHHNDLFLPWHRGYLYHFELALQDVDNSVTVPWWNWLDEDGIPAAFADAQTPEGKKNPLTGAPIQPSGVQAQPDWPQETVRDPGAPQEPAPLGPPLRTFPVGRRQVDTLNWLMSSPSYSQFERRLWAVHDNLHVWVGGTMSDPNWAGYDPLFYSHHAMVDRLWRIWQHNNPNALPSQTILDTPMTFATPPSMKVSDVLDVTELGYEYAAQVAASGAGAGG